MNPFFTLFFTLLNQSVSVYSIYLDRLAVLPDILARAAVLVPQQPPSLEVLSLGSPHHPGQ